MPKSLMNDDPQTTHGTAAVHLSLQGKGGVGKSLIASFLAQYYKARGVRAICVDTEPVNQTYLQFAAFLFRAMKSVCDSGRALRRPGERVSTFSGFLVSESDGDVPPLGHYLVAQRLNFELTFRNIRERYVQPGAVSDLADRLEPMP
jgi:hypothetical protein